MIEFLRSPWDKDFDFLINQAHRHLVISSPYVGKGPCQRIIRIKSASEENDQFFVLLLTDLSQDTLLSGATGVSSICDMADKFPHMEIRFLPSIHAKVYVADDKFAVITSGNMTDGGLLRNFEYGVKVDDRDLIRRIKRDVTDYAGLGTRMETSQLKFFAQISHELRDIRIEVDKSIKSRLRAEFQEKLNRFDGEIIRTRAAGRAPHAIFAEAILYLLARRPMPTAELHPLIQRIHPDLCDDSVDRVIDGKHFGKKWKRAVRTAQQHLKRTRQVGVRDGLWCLKDRESSELISPN